MKPQGPVIFEIDETTPAPSPADAPPIAELSPVPQGRAMTGVLNVMGRRSSWIGRLFVSAVGTLVGISLSVWAWDFVTSLLSRNPVLGYATLGLSVVAGICVLIFALRELAGIARLRRLDELRRRAVAAQASGDMSAARHAVGNLQKLYANRAELSWAHDRMRELADDALDAEALFHLAETELIAPLDAAALLEVEAAARQVATVTAIVPIALADLATALIANLRMIRRVAEIYGGHTGILGNWRLTRAVLAHLVATGAVAVGDDLIGSVAGGGLLSKLSRRFGEGVVNGALTARVGVAAMEVCRPLPFGARKRPSVTGLVRRALAGLFSRSKDGGQA